VSPVRHLLAGGILGAATYSLSQDAAGAAAVCAGSVLIDLDHLHDYCSEWGLIDGVKRLFENAFMGRSDKAKRVFILLHSWELLLILALLSVLLLDSSLLLYAIFGASVHLMMDHIGNGLRPMSYVLAYRAGKGFRRVLLEKHRPEK